MRRLIMFGLVFAFGLAGPQCWAQVPGRQVAAEQEEMASDGLDVAYGNVPGESVVELADFVSGYLADAGTVPDWMQVRLADGRMSRVSVADVFILLARTVSLWQVMGQLPETIPFSPGETNAPVIDPEDVPAGEPDLDTGREISTEQFLAQCAETVRWVDRLHVIPTAVWVEGERLSATEYLAGMAVCIQYAYYEGELYDYLFLPLPGYAPPTGWLERVSGVSGLPSPATEAEPDVLAETMYYEGAEVGETTEPMTNLPLAADQPAVTRPVRAQLMLFPEPGSELAGKVDLVASYAGPPEQFVVFAVDGATRAIVNFPPYSFRWDTSSVSPGLHSVRVTVLGNDDAVLADQISAFTVVMPKAEEAGQNQPDELDL
jgi:hypothetical protein